MKIIKVIISGKTHPEQDPSVHQEMVLTVELEKAELSPDKDLKAQVYWEKWWEGVEGVTVILLWEGASVNPLPPPPPLHLTTQAVTMNPEKILIQILETTLIRIPETTHIQ